HPASNFGKLKSTVGSSGATILPLIEGDTPDPFDLVWLGMGEEGHVASLFPHMLAEVRPGRAVIATTPIPLPAEAPYPRLSLNRRALAATRETILVVTGAAKRTVLEAALGGDERYPVSDILRGARAPVTIYWSE
ncbi:MAG TPA: 6-phosphogluconolactonase, partial [Novosphingobium sp.]|nr:6-phosphogluconolactonase [Novosphingobium sp.]